MNFLFKSKLKNPHELVKIVREAILKLGNADNRKVNDEISKSLASMRSILSGDGDHDASPEQVAQLSQETYKNDLLPLFVAQLSKFEFETRKDAVHIFNTLLRRQIGSRWPTVEYLSTQEKTLGNLVLGYEVPDIALNCGMMLRECLKHESLARIILYSQLFYNFFKYVELSTFDVASDAFASFKDILTRHKPMVADFLKTNYDEFFGCYDQLLRSDNYVTKRQSLKLLGELLLDRTNYHTMTRYITYDANLKLVMVLLRDKSKNIQYEAFHVFKIFVANPNKSKPVADILRKNKERLLEFLTNFQNDRKDDEQFGDEKAFLIKQIKTMP
ncbi:conidiophore development protein hyma [Dimargaris cristalligena]|uniref:Mo25-like protein n=1 Tax=Dimargaris cristalligena TaxID=215637 RepID=A0A4P9ZSK1_9FUNG|nr:conidiophore development protein hyma [Dimargaris cristalligena]RKP36463.1 Mo25-like protein [Dimargaris cristalligena]|eukprot:RKP36463.1 Mo25-like protein [Dimargaris cristalligena]